MPQKPQDQVSTVELAIGVVFITLLGTTLTLQSVAVVSHLLQQRRLGRQMKALIDRGEKRRPNESKRRLEVILQKLKRKVDKELDLTLQERELAADVLDPDTLGGSSYTDIAGLDELKQEIWDLVILPLREPEIIRAAPSLVKQPSGILLYGVPGCGKTMIARAIAKESQTIFLPIQASSLLRCYMGESTKLVKAAFSLARKLSPSILFIDEVDLIIGKGSSGESGAGRERDSMKAELLSLWDGISGNPDQDDVLVIGATNHPDRLDKAILRRFSRSFNIPLPGSKGREDIIRALLHDQPMAECAVSFLPRLAGNLTEGYSGSDLKELCRAAEMEPVREAFLEKSKKTSSVKESEDDGLAEGTSLEKIEAEVKELLPSSAIMKSRVAPLGRWKSFLLAIIGEVDQAESKNEPESIAAPKVNVTGGGKDELGTKEQAECVKKDDPKRDAKKDAPCLRPLEERDFHAALSKVKRTGKAAEDYKSGPPLNNTLYI